VGARRRSGVAGILFRKKYVKNSLGFLLAKQKPMPFTPKACQKVAILFRKKYVKKLFPFLKSNNFLYKVLIE